MNISPAYYHVFSATKDPWNLTHEADEEARRTWLCKGCVAPKRGVGAVDATVEVGPGKEPLNFLYSLGLARRDFLHSLGDDVVQEYLYLGKVYGPDGQELTEWATFRGKHELIVRGSKEAGYRRCDECGRIVYFAMGKKYLYPAPPSGVPLFDAGFSGMVLSEELFVRAGIKSWRGIYIDKLKVLDAPLDGLGELTA